MGSPIAPLMADVCMNYVIDQALAVTPQQFQPELLCRYVDDIFLLFPDCTSLNRFFHNINNVHTNIKFTKEMEINNCLSFLDVLVERTSSGFVTTTYRKPTHTGLYAKWSSFVPFNRKRNLVNSLLRRAYGIASSYALMHTEFVNIKRMLSRNGYPGRFLDRCIERFLNKQHNVQQDQHNCADDQSTPQFVHMSLPFLGAVSTNIHRELSGFLRKYGENSIKLRVHHRSQKLKNSFRTKEGQALLHRYNVVYRLKCSCGASYIGHTRRNLRLRLQEHSTSLDSEVCKHLQSHPDHRVDFLNPEILGGDENAQRLRILESLFIQEFKPELNIDGSSIPLCLFNI